MITKTVNMFFGVFSPIRHDLQNYLGYDVTKLRDNVRFMEIIISREGGNNNIAPLYFDGAVNFFKELPLPNEKQKLDQVYAMLDNIRRPKIAMINIENNNNKNIEEDGEDCRSFWAKWRGKVNEYCNKSRRKL